MSVRPVSLILAASLLAFPSCSSSTARQDGLRSGPMLGDLQAETVRIWAEAEQPSLYTVELAVKGQDQSWVPARNAAGEQAQLDLTADRQHGQCQIVGLLPDTTYRYRLVRDGRPQPAPFDQSFHTLPVAHEMESLRVVFGSCAGNWGIDPDQPVFRAIHAQDPDLFLWLGDNIYYGLKGREWEDPSLMEARWSIQRAMPSLQPLLADTPHYAVWDDHDYGPNDSDKEYVLRDFSLDLFTSYWPNPAAGLEGPDGVFFSFRAGPVEFFMLDTRYDRQPNRTADAKGKQPLLSESRWAWLFDGLRTSDADFKVVASGMQVLTTYHRFETWNLFPEERSRLLDFLQREAIGGVFFLSGDRHIGEAIRMPRRGTYDLIEFTSSPLAAGVGEAKPDAEVQERIPGTLAATENFGVLEFDFADAEPSLSFRLHDVYGRPLGRQVVLRLDQLQP
ncbi:MAG: alkaline phosphatase D family protein [Planctomycetota bacterium]